MFITRMRERAISTDVAVRSGAHADDVAGGCVLSLLSEPTPKSRCAAGADRISKKQCAGRRRPTALIVALAALAALALGATAAGAEEWRRRERPVAVVVVAEAPVRAAPYGGASAAATVRAGAALLVGQRYGRWFEVRRPDGVRGWVLAGEIVLL